MVVSPPGGYTTKEEAVEFAQRFANREEPYLGLHFRVEQLAQPSAFIAFCSWED